jgi:hypothetical protein
MTKEENLGKNYLTILFVLIVVSQLLFRIPGEKILLILFRFGFTAFLLYKIWAGSKWAKTILIFLCLLTTAFLFGIQIYINQFFIVFSFPALIYVVSSALLLNWSFRDKRQRKPRTLVSRGFSGRIVVRPH